MLCTQIEMVNDISLWIFFGFIFLDSWDAIAIILYGKWIRNRPMTLCLLCAEFLSFSSYFRGRSEYRVSHININWISPRCTVRCIQKQMLIASGIIKSIKDEKEKQKNRFHFSFPFVVRSFLVAFGKIFGNRNLNRLICFLFCLFGFFSLYHLFFYFYK